MKKILTGKSVWIPLLFIITAMVFSGCGKKSSGGKDNGIDLKNTTYSMEDFHADEIEGVVVECKRYGDRVYVRTNENPNSYDTPDEDYIENANSTAYFYSFAKDGSDMKKLFSLTGENENEGFGVVDYAFTPDGNAIILSYVTDPEMGMKNSLGIYDSTGNLTAPVDLDSIKPDGNWGNVGCDSAGNLYVTESETVYALDSTGNVKFNAKVESYINGLINDCKGNLLVCNSENGFKVQKLDPASKSLSPVFTTERYINKIIGGAGDYDFYYDDGNAVYGVGSDGTGKMLLYWGGSNLSSIKSGDIAAFDDGNFISSYREEEMDPSKLVRFVKVDPSKVGDRKAVVYGGVWVGQDIKDAAIQFNKSQTDYQIVFRDYADGAGADAISKMNAELLAGDIPDILDLNYIHAEKFISKGMLADLYTFMEKDKDISKDDFFENVLKAMETDGKLYSISPEFNVGVMVASSDVIGDKKSISIEDLMSIDENYPVKAFGQTTNRERVMSMLMAEDYDTLIDWTSGKCSFDSEHFEKVLEYANTYPNEEDIDYESIGYDYEALQDGKAFALEVWAFGFDDVVVYDEMMDGKEVFFGYPTSSDGLSMTTFTDFGIYSKSQVSDGAWAFIKYRLSREYAEKKTGSVIPSTYSIRKDVFEDMVKRATTTETYTDDFGQTIEPLNGEMTASMYTVEGHPLSDDQVQKVRDVIASISRKSQNDNTVYDIINEEAGAYFSGQKSAKEVAALVQNRVSTYVNENK